MSRASKVFFTTAVGFMGATIWGVHWLQQRESDVRAPPGVADSRPCTSA
jgi:hypothetical protein